MNRPPRPPPAASVRVVRHDLPAPDQALHNGLHLLALILGFLVLPGIALAGVWYAWWPGSIGVPAAMASPVLSVFWSHLLRRNLLLDAAPVDAGRLRGSPCPPGLWRSIAGHLVRGGAGIPAWPGSHSAVGRFVEEAFAPQRSNASAVVWHDDHAVLIWHRPDGPDDTSPCDHFHLLVVVDAGTEPAEGVLRRVTSMLEDLRARPEETRARTRSARVETNPAFRAVVHEPVLLVVGGADSLRAPMLRLWASPALHYHHPGELWVGSLAMAAATPGPPVGVLEAVEAALGDLARA
jgi:hypothetical protein